MSKNDMDQSKEFQLLHDQYQAVSTELPPENLDAAILKAAHQAVLSDSNVSAITPIKPSQRQWYKPVSAVAILVVSLSVFLKLAFEPTVMMPESEQPISSAPESIAEQMQERRLEKTLAREQAMKQQLINAQATQVQKRAKRSLQASKKHEMAARARISAPASRTASVAPMASQAPSNVEIGAKDTSSTQQKIRLSSIAQAPVVRKNTLSSLQQQSKIDELMALLNRREYPQLKQALIKYRKDYPVNLSELALPPPLINWEKANNARSLQND